MRMKYRKLLLHPLKLLLEFNEVENSAATCVHKILGPGLLESIYEEALCYELHLRGVKFDRQKTVPIPYKGVKLNTPLRMDLLVENKVIVELKAKERLSPIDKPQLLTYFPYGSMPSRYEGSYPRKVVSHMTGSGTGRLSLFKIE